MAMPFSHTFTNISVYRYKYIHANLYTHLCIYLTFFSIYISFYIYTPKFNNIRKHLMCSQKALVVCLVFFLFFTFLFLDFMQTLMCSFFFFVTAQTNQPILPQVCGIPLQLFQILVVIFLNLISFIRNNITVHANRVS